MNGETKLVEKFTLYGKPKDVKRGGSTCKNDSGSGLFLKRGNRFVIIGKLIWLCQEPKKTSCPCVNHPPPLAHSVLQAQLFLGSGFYYKYLESELGMKVLMKFLFNYLHSWL